MRDPKLAHILVYTCSNLVGTATMHLHQGERDDAIGYLEKALQVTICTSASGLDIQFFTASKDILAANYKS